MSEVGRGVAEYVTLAESADRAVDKIIKRIEKPVLTDVTAKFEGRDITDQLPLSIPDVFDETPIVIHGRFRNPGPGKLTLTGKLGGKPWSQTIDLRFGSEQNNPAILSLWGRKKIDVLSSSAVWVDSEFKSTGNPEAKITQVALEFGLMSAYTSFVAVEERIINVDGKPRTVRVPVEQVEGVDYGVADSFSRSRGLPGGGGFGGGTTGGTSGGGMGGGAMGGGMASMPTRGSITHLGGPTGGLAKAKSGSSSADKAEAKSSFEPQSKVSEKLEKTDKEQLVQILVTKLDPKFLEELKKLGFKVDFSDEGLKVIIGRVKGSLLEKISENPVVVRITPPSA
jgi:Ca-activated chloride channel family protein